MRIQLWMMQHQRACSCPGTQSLGSTFSGVAVCDMQLSAMFQARAGATFLHDAC